MFISYDVRNGVEYAKLCISKRNGKTVSKSYIYLGKVVDKEKFIFFNKDRGLFNYNPVDNSYTSLNSQSNIYSLDKPTTQTPDDEVQQAESSAKINDIEFQRAKFNNELPKISSEPQIPQPAPSFQASPSFQPSPTFQPSPSFNENYNQQAPSFENTSHQPTQPTPQAFSFFEENKDNNEVVENFNSPQPQPRETPNIATPKINEPSIFSQQEELHYSKNFSNWEKSAPIDIKNILKNTVAYGDVDFVKKIITENQINDVIDLANVANKDLLYVLIFHNILGNNCSNVQHWYEHSFIKYLYPNVDCREESIYEELETQEEKFFSLYQQNVVTKLDLSTVNITNTLGEHRLLINHEGIPLCCMDSRSSLGEILDFLKENKIAPEQFIVKIDDLHDFNADVKLLANVTPQHDLYDIILDSYSVNNLEFIKFGEIFYQICKKQIQYEQYNLFTYTFCDILKQSQRTIQTLSNYFGEMPNFNMVFDNIVVSNFDFESKRILEIIKMHDPFKQFSFNSQSSIINFISAIVISAMCRGLKINFFDAIQVLKNVKCFVDPVTQQATTEDFDYSTIFIY